MQSMKKYKSKIKFRVYHSNPLRMVPIKIGSFTLPALPAGKELNMHILSSKFYSDFHYKRNPTIFMPCTLLFVKKRIFDI